MSKKSEEASELGFNQRYDAGFDSSGEAATYIQPFSAFGTLSIASSVGAVLVTDLPVLEDVPHGSVGILTPNPNLWIMKESHQNITDYNTCSERDIQV